MNRRKLLAAGLVSLFLATSPAQAIETGEMAPDFKLPSADGKEMSLSDLKGQTVVLEWFNQDCPYVKKHYGAGDMQALQKKWTEKGVKWLVLSSTNEENDSFRNAEQFRALAEEMKVAASAVIVDAKGEVGKAYSAKTTPHMFVINSEGKLAYQGAIDDNPDVSSDPKAAKNFIDLALAEVTEGKEITQAETKPYGCGVKY